MANKFGFWAVLVVSASCGLHSQACSEHSDACRDARTCDSSLAEAGAQAASAGAGALAGLGGASDSAGVAGSLGSAGFGISGSGAAGSRASAPNCTTDTQCDDHLRCNGVETCLGGACQPGKSVQCEHASTCREGAGTTVCTYPDSSAWLVYEADEEVAARDELYAVKESLLGTQKPIKLSTPLPNAPTEHLTPMSFTWSADAQWLTFGTSEKDDWVATRYYAVHFTDGVPEAPIAISTGLARADYWDWSPTGHELLFRASGGDLYWIHLSDQGADAPVQLNLPNQIVKTAIWAADRNVVYVTSAGTAYRVTVGPKPPVAPSPFITAGQTFVLDWCWSSPDGVWVIFSSAERAVLIADVGTRVVNILPSGALEPTEVSWQFSPDSHYLVYAAWEKVAARTQLYSSDLRKGGQLTLIESVELWGVRYVLGDWAPDSSFFTYFGDPGSLEPDKKRLNVYDLATGKSARSNYDVALDERLIGFGPDQKSALYSPQSSSTSSQLKGFDRSANARTFDEDTAGRPYYSAEFSANGLAGLYCTQVGEDAATDMVYADLRPPVRARSVRVPGDGSVYSCMKGFAPDSKGFAYYRFAPDGARVLYWVDITKQVMSKPIQISGEGRVQLYYWQPLDKAKK